MSSNRETAHALLEAIGLKNPQDWSCMVGGDGLWQHGERCLRAQAALDAREAETWEAADKLAGDRAKEWAAATGAKRTHANMKLTGRAVEAAELAVLFEARARAARNDLSLRTHDTGGTGGR